MEIWDLYDDQRRRLPFTHVRGLPMPVETYHLVTDVWTVTLDGAILITQRHWQKKHGGLWECNGGAAQQGEDSVTSAIRELGEETGIHIQKDELHLLHSMKTTERFVDTYVTLQAITLADLQLQPEEVIGARLVSFDELVHLWESGHVVPRERFGLYKDALAQFIATKKV